MRRDGGRGGRRRRSVKNEDEWPDFFHFFFIFFFHFRVSFLTRWLHMSDTLVSDLPRKMDVGLVGGPTFLTGPTGKGTELSFGGVTRRENRFFRYFKSLPICHFFFLREQLATQQNTGFGKKLSMGGDFGLGEGGYSEASSVIGTGTRSLSRRRRST